MDFRDPNGLMTMRIPVGYRPFSPPRALPRGSHGEHLPESDFPHTQLGTQSGRRGSYPQTKEWGAKCDRGYDGNTPKDVKDWTNHGRGRDHPDPHRHPYNPETGKKGSAEPIHWWPQSHTTL